MTWVRGVLTLLAIAVAGTTARAEKIAIADAHGEPDVVDEAGAVSLLVRSALVGSDRTLVELPKQLTLSTAGGALPKAAADHALVMELARDGTGLRATVVLIGPDGAPDVTLLRAGDGEVQKLAAAVVAHVIGRLHLEPAARTAGSLGKLRPFATAVRLRPTDATAAAKSLGDALPLAATSVPAVVPALQGLDVREPALAVLAARAIGDVARLDALAAGGDPDALAAKAFAAIQRSDLREASAVPIAKGGGLLALVRATLAESGSDDKRLGQLLVAGLAGEHGRAVLALASTVAPARLSPDVHRALLAAAERGIGSPGATALVGLGAAEAKVEVPRALALVSVRELDDYELERLAAVLGDGSDATSLRLRVELAMRRGDGKDAPAIEAFATAAPDDARAQRYLGWLLMERGKFREAAAAFAKASARGEQARALLYADDAKAALAALGHAPQTPEELVIAARAALADGKLDDAARALADAELLAPVNPLVAAAVIDLAAKRPDPKRVASARLVIERGTRNGRMLLKVDTGTARPIEVKTETLGSGSAQPTVHVREDIDARALEPLLEALPGLGQLPHKKLVIVAAERDDNGWLALRTTHTELVGLALAKLLTAQPYRLKVTPAPDTLDADHITPEALAALVVNNDAVLVYGAEHASGTDADVTLLLYARGETTATTVARTITMEGLVVWKRAKIIVLAVIGTILLLLMILWITRGMGRVRIEIQRPVDVAAEALCIEISRNAVRPKVRDLDEFFAKTKKAGTITKRTYATLVTSGMTFKIPLGTWYVHLFGCYTRGDRMYPVPDECTREVEIERGSHHELTFDLTTKLAELTVIVESEPKAGITVYAGDTPHVHTNKDGIAVLMLPIGAHTIVLEKDGQRVEKPMQIVAAKLQRIAVNFAREIRHAGGIQLDAAASGQFTLDLAAEPTRPSARSVAHDKTQHATNPVATNPVHAPAPAPAATNGLLLGRYKLLGELGRGAMGVVHRARDEKLERDVAIKEMAGELRTNATALQLFTSEAKALAQLNHSNIVAMYDQITDERGIYMIMELVDGPTLEAILAERGALPWPEAIAVIDQLCAGLTYAHARKVIHRDIKPGNIFIANDDTVKLGDFGLARVMREVTIRKTEVRGTPLYMAPEQITGTDVNHRADLYAVGSTLFELVCGRPPFLDDDVLYAKLHNAPPVPSSIVPGLPSELDALILELMAKNPHERPSSAAEVRETLTRLMRG